MVDKVVVPVLRNVLKNRYVVLYLVPTATGLFAVGNIFRLKT